MPNSYFQFKQFRIQQDRCAMKVCTDSCVLGAYAEIETSRRVLDIGTGTGLLALMLAQRSTACIDAVEIDSKAYAQARENIAGSPWPDRIHAHCSRIQEFTASQPYDLIVANPPFFSHHLKRRQDRENIALHADHLPLADLAQAVTRLLHPAGRFTVLLPPYESTQVEKVLAFTSLFPVDRLRLYNRPGGRLFRVIATYAYHQTACREPALIITGADGHYTEAFVQLLKPYYLHL